MDFQGSFRDFLKNIEKTIIKLTTLEIKTVVGDYTVAPDDSVQPIAGGDFKVMYSKINLLDGDITTQLSHPLTAPEYDWLRDFHARKEEHGHEIINNNIKALISLIELYKSAKNTAAKDTPMPVTLTESNQTMLTTSAVATETVTNTAPVEQPPMVDYNAPAA